MSQAWVFRKDDYDKILHKVKVLADRVEKLEKKLDERDGMPDRKVEAVETSAAMAK